VARLRHVSGDALTVERRRQGVGFGYFSADGARLRDRAFAARARALAIPPAWQEVRIAPYERAHIQARGIDAAGRVQYLYHPDWEARRTRAKQRHLSALAAGLPRLRRRVRQDLEADAGTKTLALAIALTLLDRTAMRVGRERYLVANGTRGAGTLFTRDVTIAGDRVELSFPAKSGKRSSYRFEDARLAAAIARIKTIPGRRLLMLVNGEGRPRPLRTDEINAYLKEITGAPVTAKDFRTLHASALAAEALAGLERSASATGRKRQVAEVIRQVAAFLQNTPAVCRKSYVAPCLIENFEQGTLADTWSAGEPVSGLRQREARLVGVLAAAA
jgi:DNA topoisomerase-1